MRTLMELRRCLKVLERLPVLVLEGGDVAGKQANDFRENSWFQQH